MYFIHKHQIAKLYGGREEGGWYYDSGVPVTFKAHVIPIPSEKLAYKICRWLNAKEQERADKEELYDYTSVLSYRSTHYSFSVAEHMKPVVYPETRPHYE